MTFTYYVIIYLTLLIRKGFAKYFDKFGQKSSDEVRQMQKFVDCKGKIREIADELDLTKSTVGDPLRHYSESERVHLEAKVRVDAELCLIGMDDC